MKKKQPSDGVGVLAAKYQVDLVTQFRFSQIWHNNLFAYAERRSWFETLEEAQAEASFRNASDGIDFNRHPETFWRVRE
jgi:hypothetical protein